MPDMINPPPHYTACRPQVEPIDLAECMGFNLGNAVKYLSRAGRKEGEPYEKDVCKAIFYLRREHAFMKELRVTGMCSEPVSTKALSYFYWFITLSAPTSRCVPPLKTAGPASTGWAVGWTAWWNASRSPWKTPPASKMKKINNSPLKQRAFLWRNDAPVSTGDIKKARSWYNIICWGAFLIILLPVGIANFIFGYIFGDSPCTLCWGQSEFVCFIGIMGFFIVRYGFKPKYLASLLLMSSVGLYASFRHVALHAARDVGQGFGMDVFGIHTHPDVG